MFTCFGAFRALELEGQIIRDTRSSPLKMLIFLIALKTLEISPDDQSCKQCTTTFIRVLLSENSPHLLLLLFVHSQLLTLFHILPPRFRCLITSRKRVEFIFSEDAHSSHSEGAQDDNFLSGWMRHEPLFPILFLCGLNYLCQGRCVIGSVITQNLWMHLHDFFNFLIFFIRAWPNLEVITFWNLSRSGSRGWWKGSPLWDRAELHIFTNTNTIEILKREIIFFFDFAKKTLHAVEGIQRPIRKCHHPTGIKLTSCKFSGT